jgi:hypothetical protein
VMANNTTTGDAMVDNCYNATITTLGMSFATMVDGHTRTIMLDASSTMLPSFKLTTSA